MLGLSINNKLIHKCRISLSCSQSLFSRFNKSIFFFQNHLVVWSNHYEVDFNTQFALYISHPNPQILRSQWYRWIHADLSSGSFFCAKQQTLHLQSFQSRHSLPRKDLGSERKRIWGKNSLLSLVEGSKIKMRSLQWLGNNVSSRAINRLWLSFDCDRLESEETDGEVMSCKQYSDRSSRNLQDSEHVEI